MIDRVRRPVLVVAAVSIIVVSAWGDSPMLFKATVVRPEHEAWLVEHAAEELASYVERMTSATVRVVGETPRAIPGQSGVTHAGLEVVLVLTLDGRETLQALPGGDNPDRLRDGFVIQSEGPDHLRIAAAEPIGLLYGVYEYLERYCGVGFFWDGDRVPKRSALPTEGIKDAQLPRWPLRHFSFSSCWGLDKWHHQFRTMAERKRLLDWMAKRRLNLSSHFFGPHIGQSGVSAKRVFDISDAEPDNFTFAGWPGALDFPAEVRTGIIQGQLDYGRQRGIRWIYYLAYGNVPHQFRELHPEYKYVDQLGYSATVLYPDDPECTRWAEAFYKDLLATYGTDHIYQDCPFVESSGAADPEVSFQLKLTAAQRMCEVFKKLDEAAIWESDAWDFGALPHVWTPERITRYFSTLPQDMMLIYDTAGLANPFYKRTNYFEGTRWTLGILHSFQGDDHLHGDLQHALGAIQKLSADPNAAKCLGIYHVPETSGHNVLFFDLTTHLAWNLDGLDLEDYLDRYTRRRYGEAHFAAMRPAVGALVRAVYRGGGQMPIYQKLGCHYGRWWWPIVSDQKPPDDWNINGAIGELREAVRLALACRRVQQDNPLYVNDLVDWTRTYLAHVFNAATIDAFRAFERQDAEAVKSSADLAGKCLEHIEAILSTRPDFSLGRQIEGAMQVPGANPHLPWYMKQHCINDLYSANEVYEQLHWYYAPRMKVYFAELEKRVAEGVTTIAWDDIAERCNAIQNRWLNEDITVPDDEKFPGATMEAVVTAFEVLGRPEPDAAPVSHTSSRIQSP